MSNEWPETLVERVTSAIYDAPNGIDGDQLADMLIEDFRISSALPAENRNQVLSVCRYAAKAALDASGLREAIEALEDIAGGKIKAGTNRDATQEYARVALAHLWRGALPEQRG